MNTTVVCPTCGNRSWGCRCNARPKINNYSKLEGNRDIETRFGLYINIHDAVMNEDGTPADSRNPAAVMNTAKGETNGLTLWCSKDTLTD